MKNLFFALLIVLFGGTAEVSVHWHDVASTGREGHLYLHKDAIWASGSLLHSWEREGLRLRLDLGESSSQNQASHTDSTHWCQRESQRWARSLSPFKNTGFLLDAYGPNTHSFCPTPTWNTTVQQNFVWWWKCSILCHPCGWRAPEM